MNRPRAAGIAGTARRGRKSFRRTARYFRLGLLAKPPEGAQVLVAWGFVAALLWALATLTAGDPLPLGGILFFALAALLAAIAAIDARWGLVPDELLLGLVASGLIHALSTRPVSASIGTIAGIGVVVAIGCAVRAVAAAWLGRDALGLGDVKLLSAAVPFIGLQGLLLMGPIALGSALAAVALGGRAAESDAIPLGPHLGLGLLWAVLLGAAP